MLSRISVQKGFGGRTGSLFGFGRGFGGAGAAVSSAFGGSTFAGGDGVVCVGAAVGGVVCAGSGAFFKVTSYGEAVK
jgi:hypothetical protein